MRVRSLWAGLILLSGCAPTPHATIPVTTAAGSERLAGEWTGEFSSAETGRHGNITFHLSSAADSAAGEVLMFLRDRTQPIWRAEAPPDPGNPETIQWLSIRFVELQGDSVSGAIEPYSDPRCECVVQTTFRGRLTGDAIEGSYETYAPSRNYRSGGSWKVTRK